MLKLSIKATCPKILIGENIENSMMRKEVEVWWKQAERDVRSAEKNITIEEYALVVFLCQQAVEKGLKAYFLQVKKQSPGLTHSLIYLASEADVPEKFFKFLRRLTPEFVTTRYPDAAYGSPNDLYDKEIAEDHLQQTKEVIAWLKSKILL